ncbi:MAG: RagB/SusD family nutrient uptake outer membrane protein [Sphingobacterium sp.]
MKNILPIFIGLSLVLTSCKNVLDIDDLQSLDEEKVWHDPNLVSAYMANLYTIFGNWEAGKDRYSEQLVGIPFQLNTITPTAPFTGTTSVFKIWDYAHIRKINTAIQNVSESETLAQDFKDKTLGEAYFIRAYTYFEMLRLYGGIPYITIPQDAEQDDLNTPRNSTAETFDLLIADLDEAIALLPETIEKGSDEYGRIDGNFAAAFKAKVLLYKASPQFNPSNPFNNSHWQEANSANKLAYEQLIEKGYALTDDYANITLQEKGPEVVFSVINTYPNKVANWDNGVRPGSESRGAANAVPTWEFVKSFPMKDGKSYLDTDGKYHKTEEEFLQSYWENRDPRFDKSIVWNGKIYEVSGKVGKRQYTSLGIADALDNFGVNPRAGINSTNQDRYSGLFILKNSKLSLKQAEAQTQYDVDYVLMRLAEVMLNYAETANETGDLATAEGLLIELRKRDGIEGGADGKYGLTARNREEMREAILAERNIELCFEGHRFWDLRRSRKLDVLDGGTKHGVEAIAINTNGSEMDIKQANALASAYELVETNFKYNVLQVPQNGVKVSVVPDSYYFFPIEQSIIDRNPKVLQNQDWGGEFNPTME